MDHVKMVITVAEERILLGLYWLSAKVDINSRVIYCWLPLVIGLVLNCMS